MHKIINITLKAIAAMLMLAAAASCVFEKDNPSGTDQQKYKYVLVQLGVNTDRMTPTKADGDVTGADDEAGSPAETAINDLRVYAYTKDGENGAMVLRGYFHAQDVDAAATATKPLLMDIKVPFEEYGDTKQVYFMAVANAGGMTGTDGIIINSIGRDPQTGALVLPDSFGFGEFAGIRYSVADQTFAKGMPMYCQTSAAVEVNLGAAGTTSTEPGHNGHTKLPVKVTLDLTRSLSKIEVYAAEAAAVTTGKDATTTTSVTITGVSLANVPASGNLFTAPAAGATLTYTDFNGDNTDGTGYSASFLKNETVSKKVDQDASDDIKNPDNYTLVSNAYYLAENNQGATATYEYGPDAYPVVGDKIVTDAGEKEVEAAATVLKIDYNIGGTDKTGYVKMPQIKRNTWYKVLAKITAGKEISLNILALPWDDAEDQTINFLDNVTLKNSAWVEGDGFTDDPQNAKLSFGPGNDKAATFKFTLDTPRNGTWYATIEDGDIQNFTFVDENNNEVKTVSGDITGAEQSFTIKPLESLSMGEKKSVKLRLVAVTENNSRSLIVKFGNKDFYTIEQSYNLTNN